MAFLHVNKFLQAEILIYFFVFFYNITEKTQQPKNAAHSKTTAAATTRATTTFRFSQLSQRLARLLLILLRVFIDLRGLRVSEDSEMREREKEREGDCENINTNKS